MTIVIGFSGTGKSTFCSNDLKSKLNKKRLTYKEEKEYIFSADDYFVKTDNKGNILSYNFNMNEISKSYEHMKIKIEGNCLSEQKYIYIDNTNLKNFT